jgi:hypothetical protein
VRRRLRVVRLILLRLRGEWMVGRVSCRKVFKITKRLKVDES